MNSNKFHEEYEKLKTVGQGAFGTATLYRRVDDGKQVVMKEVFLMDMDNSERKAAMNEVEILSNLNHPNIIRYLGSFQKEGSLIIVMEYADGGNLAQLINAKKNKNEIFTEKSILNILSQICSALSYMHNNKILHRDLKSANIFLNMNRNVKVGDFGISKMLNTRSQAQTVVGTPYYLSPEMCEGYDYNEKSDIWAVGCILYEMASLRKPFEALTLPVLVQKITSCEYEDIPKVYSEELSLLVRSILQKSPELRPPAKHIHGVIIPKIMKKNQNVGLETPSSFSYTLKIGAPMERSILYKLFDFGDDQKIIPQELPHKKIIDFSVSVTHHIIITEDGNVYTYGENNFGQLAIKEAPKKKQYATFINWLQDEKIEKCAAGNGFSIFLNKEGIVYTCGDGRQGCLGHGNWDIIDEPTIIDALIHEKISQICCGDEHVVALSSEGKVFTWGSSKFGQLGQGHTQHRCKPLAIKLLNLTKIKSVHCGENETVLLTTNGQVLVSGNNNYGKLGVPDQEKIKLFTPVLHLKEKIKYVSVGPNHSSLLTESGTVIVLGQNSTRLVSEAQIIKIKNVKMVACGSNFTVAGDNKNVLWFWGSYKTAKNLNMASSDKSVKSSNSVLPLFKSVQDETMIIKDFDVKNQECQVEFVKIPRPILALYSSNSNVKSGNIILMDRIEVKNDNLYLLAHTTAPPPVKQFTNSNIQNTNTMSQMEDTTMAPSKLVNLPNVV